MPDPAIAEVVLRAEAYPFDLPFGSYHFPAGLHQTVSEIEPSRVPVLAIGSNAAPSQLARKFPGCPEGIPVTRAVMHDHAVVFSAHFASYGSVPATLVAYRGASCWVFVTWMSECQLQILHESEGMGERYDFVALEGASLLDEVMGPLGSVHAYVSRAGPLLHERVPIRIAEVPTIGCALPALTQRGVLHWVHRHLAPLTDYAVFVRRVAADASFRRASNVALRRLAQPLLPIPRELAVV